MAIKNLPLIREFLKKLLLSVKDLLWHFRIKLHPIHILKRQFLTSNLLYKYKLYYCALKFP